MPPRRSESPRLSSRRCSELVEVRFAEGVALVGVTGGGLLNAVVSHRRRRGQRVGNVLVTQRFQVRNPGALLLDGRGVVRPHPGVAVGLQFGAHAVAAGALRALLGTAENPLQILHMVAELVSNHVLLRQWSTA